MIDQNRTWIQVEAPAVLKNLKDPKSGKAQKRDLALQGPTSLKILQAIAEERPVERLINLGIHVGTNSVGEEVSVLELERTETLQSLHEEVMRRLAPYLSHDVEIEMLFSPPAAAGSTLLWIKDYPEKSSFERFFPHITLGYGQLDSFPLPRRFAQRGYRQRQRHLPVAKPHLGRVLLGKAD